MRSKPPASTAKLRDSAVAQASNWLMTYLWI